MVVCDYDRSAAFCHDCGAVLANCRTAQIPGATGDFVYSRNYKISVNLFDEDDNSSDDSILPEGLNIFAFNKSILNRLS